VLALVVALLILVVVLARSAGDDDLDAAITTTLAPTPSAAPSTTVAATTTSSTTTVASVDTTSWTGTTSTTSTSTTSTTTTTTTPVRVATPGPVTLVETGLALDTGTIVPFGQDEQLVIAELASILGDPVTDSESQTEFCEGTSVRFVRWGSLEVVFTNTDEGTPRRFTQWFADGHLDPTGLVTPEGLGESATVGFLEVTFPNVLDLVPAFDDDIVGIFAVVNPTTGQRFNGTTLGLDPNGVVTSLWAGDTCARVFT